MVKIVIAQSKLPAVLCSYFSVNAQPLTKLVDYIEVIY